MLEPGWLERQFAAMEEERKTFPQWMKDVIAQRRKAPRKEPSTPPLSREWQ